MTYSSALVIVAIAMSLYYIFSITLDVVLQPYRLRQIKRIFEMQRRTDIREESRRNLLMLADWLSKRNRSWIYVLAVPFAFLKKNVSDTQSKRDAQDVRDVLLTTFALSLARSPLAFFFFIIVFGICLLIDMLRDWIVDTVRKGGKSHHADANQLFEAIVFKSLHNV